MARDYFFDKDKNKINQPGTINKGLADSARNRAADGYRAIASGRANYSGEEQPDKPRPFGGFFEPKPNAPDKGNTFYKLGQDYNTLRTQMGDLYETDAKLIGAAKQRGAQFLRDKYQTVNNALQSFSSGAGLQSKPNVSAASPSAATVPIADTDFSDYDAEFGNLPDRTISLGETAPVQEPVTPVAPVEEPPQSYSVLGAPEVTKQQYVRDDGSLGTLYSNVGGQSLGTSAAAQPASSSTYGPNYDQSDELSQINADISNMFKPGTPEISFEQLMAYDNAKKVEQRNKSTANRLRYALSTGKINARRFGEAMSNLTQDTMAAQQAAQGYQSKPAEILAAEADMLAAQGTAKAGGSRAAADVYRAGLERQTAMEELAATDAMERYKAQLGLEGDYIKSLADLGSTDPGLDFLESSYGSQFYNRGSGLGTPPVSDRAALRALEERDKANK